MQTFVISTAGEASERDESILGRLLDQNEAAGELEETPGLTVSRNHAARTLIFNYSAPTTDPHDLAAVKLANPASWVTRAYLKRQSVSPEITAGEFLQLHANVWSTSVGAWIPPEAWEACLEPGIAPAAGTDIVCGVDIGLVDDSSAVAVAWQLDDGRIAVDTKVWSARSESAADVHVPGGVIDLELVEDYLRELHSRYRLSVTAYDRRFFERSAALLGLDGLVLAPLEQNSKNMAEALEGWHQAVLGGQVAHPGNPVFTAHVLGAAAERTDRGWKVSKTRSHRKIDALVAAVMARHTLERNPPGSVYDQRGLIVI